MVKEAKEKGGTEKIKGERLGRPLPQVNPKLKGTTDIWSGLASKQDPLDVTCVLAPGWSDFSPTAGDTRLPVRDSTFIRLKKES